MYVVSTHLGTIIILLYIYAVCTCKVQIVVKFLYTYTCINVAFILSLTCQRFHLNLLHNVVGESEIRQRGS